MTPLLLLLPALSSLALLPAAHSQADVLIRHVTIVDVEHAR
jgi:hypothetical protein